MNRANQGWVLETKEKVVLQKNEGLCWSGHYFMKICDMVMEPFPKRPPFSLVRREGICYCMYKCNTYGEFSMSTNNLLRKAKPVNVREAQAQLSKLIRSKSPSMVLSHGKPVSFLIPYEDMLDLVETLDELKDKKLLGEIERARKEYAQGKVVPAEHLFKKMGV